ncbi:hypothetical protein LAZ67_1002023, partial [Cordylochernes scorpioides]
MPVVPDKALESKAVSQIPSEMLHAMPLLTIGSPLQKDRWYRSRDNFSQIDSCQPNAIGASETKLKPNHLFKVKGFKIQRKDRPSADGGGGLLTLIKDLSFEEIVTPSTTHTELQAFKIHPPNQRPLTIVNTYHPPQKPGPELDLISHLLDEIRKKTHCERFGRAMEAFNTLKRRSKLDKILENSPIAGPKPGCKRKRRSKSEFSGCHQAKIQRQLACLHIDLMAADFPEEHFVLQFCHRHYRHLALLEVYHHIESLAIITQKDITATVFEDEITKCKKIDSVSFKKMMTESEFSGCHQAKIQRQLACLHIDLMAADFPEEHFVLQFCHRHYRHLALLEVYHHIESLAVITLESLSLERTEVANYPGCPSDLSLLGFIYNASGSPINEVWFFFLISTQSYQGIKPVELETFE